MHPIMRSLMAVGGVFALAATGLAAPAAQAVPGPTVVSGKVTYQDKAGTVHPSRRTFVELRDADGSAEGTSVDSGLTSATGAYHLSASTKRPDGTPRRLFVRSHARAAGYHVYEPGGTRVYRLGSTPVQATGAAQTVNLKPVGLNSNHNGAYAIADALTSGRNFAASVAWGKVPDVRVSFPEQASTYRANRINLAAADRFDWDVILHEYGHHLAQKLQVAPSVGGRHSLFTNLSATHGKTRGVQLAWSEGVATWLAITAQQQQNVAALGIPRAGDTRYDDPEKNYAADLASGAGGTAKGEDDEAAVARTLWQVENNAAFAVGRTALLGQLRTAKPTTLSTALPVLMRAAGAQPFTDTTSVDPAALVKSNQIACAIDDFAFSPTLTTPVQDAVLYAEPVEFTWQAGGAGPDHPLRVFGVEFWDEGFTTRLYYSPPIADTSWTPSRTQWQELLDATDQAGARPSRVQVVVSGSGADPDTGPYNGCSQRQLRPEVTITPAAADGHLRPPAYGTCAALEASGGIGGSPGLTVTGVRLRPNTDYELVLHREAEDHPDVIAFSVTTGAFGSISAVTKNIPAMPGGDWEQRLRERHDPEKYVTVDGIADVWAWICWRSIPVNSDLITIDQWGGMGAEPMGTAAIEWTNNGRHTATADALGNYSGQPHQTTCNGQGAVVGHLTVDTLDGLGELYRSAFCSGARSGPQAFPLGRTPAGPDGRLPAATPGRGR